jgi:WD40 repeat protein
VAAADPTQAETGIDNDNTDMSALLPPPFATLALTTVDGMANTIRGCAFSPDGKSLVAVCDNSSVWRWDLLQPRPAPTLEQVVGNDSCEELQTELNRVFASGE